MTAGILLAAGVSARMGGANKLLLPWRGEPMVRLPARALVEAGLRPVIAVLGHEAGAVGRALEALPVRTVFNPDFREGMGASLRAGVQALPPDAVAVAVALGDLPALSAPIVRAVVAAFRASPRGIAVPVFRGRRGHPVVFDLERYRPALLGLRGDRGARDVVAAHPGDVLEVPVDDPAVIRDVDTPDAYEGVEGDDPCGFTRV